MAARKLHMPGTRERIGAGAGAGAGAVAEGVVQNGNGVCMQPPGGSRRESRLGSPIMQPLPLASRYGGANHDSLRPASAALQSSWIQRLRPAPSYASCRELGHEVAQVWRDPQILWDSNTHLLFAEPSKEPLHHPLPKVAQQQPEADDGGDTRLMVRDQPGESKAPVRNVDCVDKGKGRNWVHPVLETTKIAGQVKNDNSRTAQLQQVKPPVFCSGPKDVLAGEGSSRRAGVDSPHEVNNGVSMHSSLNPQPNGVSGALVTGFGPLRVVLKASVGNSKNKSVGCSSKLKGPLMEGIHAVDVPYSGSQYMAVPDRNREAPSAGLQGMVASLPGRSSQPTMKSSPDRKVEIEHERHILWPGKLLGGGFYSPQRTGYGLDNCRPFTLHHAQAPGRERTFGYPGCPNGNRSAVEFLPAGEDHPMVHSMKGWYPALSAIGSGLNRDGKGMAATHSFGPIIAEEGRIDFGQQQEGKYCSRTNPETSGTHVYVANRLESRKAKEVVDMDECIADIGRSQQQASHLSPLFAPYQSPLRTAFGKQPVAISPARSPSHRVEDEARTVYDGEDSSQERPEKIPSLTPLFGPPKPCQDVMEGTSGKPAWSSLFAAYQVPNQPGEPPNSNSSTGTVPRDVRLRVYEGQNPGNRLSSCPGTSGNQDNESGGSARTGVHPAGSSAEARSLFDNQSSHFLSSPWPVDDGHNPTDDAGSAFHSQASYTPSLQVPRDVLTPNTHLKGQENIVYKYDVGGSSVGVSKDVSYKRARSIERSGSLSPGLRNSSGGIEASRGPRYTDEENHARGPVKNSRPPPMPSFSGPKDDTSGSSPPSLPMGCNYSSDLCSTVFPGTAVEDRGKSRAVHSKTANLDSETDALLLGKRQQGLTSTPGLVARRKDGNEPQRQINLGLRKEPRETVARLCKDVEGQDAQPKFGDVVRVGSKMCRQNETGDYGQKQSRLRNSSDIVGEADTSGPSKRSRHHPNQNSWDFQGGGSGVHPREQENDVRTDKSSSWLSRWLAAGSNSNGIRAGTNPPTRPKDGTKWNGFAPAHPENGRSNRTGGLSGDGPVHRSRVGGHVRRMDGNGSDQWNNMNEFSAKRAVFGLPPFSTPSAAAMALVGTAARKLGPLPSQRKGSISMWPTVHVETTQTPEPQKSVRSSEFPTSGSNTIFKGTFI